MQDISLNLQNILSEYCREESAVEFKAREVIFVIIIGVLITSLGLCSNKRGKEPANPDSPQTSAKILVHVSGQVEHPGVYSLDAGSRIIDAVSAAGGALQDADLHRLNLAAYLTDGQKVTVPSAVPDSGPNSGFEHSLVNINTSDQKTLETLPNIGPARAERIIEYREIHGGFSSIEEIINVPGIGSGIYDSIKDLVTY